MSSDPIIVYKDGDSQLVAAVDLPGWTDDGWATELVEPEPPTEAGSSRNSGKAKAAKVEAEHES
jgi:hypothetical protein